MSAQGEEAHGRAPEWPGAPGLAANPFGKHLAQPCWIDARGAVPRVPVEWHPLALWLEDLRGQSSCVR